jgi:hypothetical protein
MSDLDMALRDEHGAREREIAAHREPAPQPPADPVAEVWTRILALG